MVSVTVTCPPADPHTQFARYAIHSRPEILFLLRTIHKRNLLVHLNLPDRRHAVITSVLAVDEASHALILDVARDETLNRELLAGSRAEFRCSVDGVAIWFELGRVRACDFGKLPALWVALPASLIRLQRREHFRMPLPTAHPVQCIVPPLTDNALEPIIAHIIDIGCGGVAIAESSGRLKSEIGHTLPECRLLLPQLEMLVTTLEIGNTAQVRLHNGVSLTRFGCRFADLSHEKQASLQRFIMDLERARRNGL